MDYRAVTPELLKQAIDTADEQTFHKPEDTYMSRWRAAVCDVLVAALEAARPASALAWTERDAEAAAKAEEAAGDPDITAGVGWPASEPGQTCATCKHGKWSPSRIPDLMKWPRVCVNPVRLDPDDPGVTMPVFDRRVPDTFYCNQWEAGAPARTPEGE